MIIKLDVGFGENEQIDGFFAFAFAIYEKKRIKLKDVRICCAMTLLMVDFFVPFFE